MKFDENDVLIPSGVPIDGENINGDQEYLQQPTLLETSEKLKQNSDLSVENPPTSDHSQNTPASQPNHLGPEFEQPPISTVIQVKRLTRCSNNLGA